MTQIIEDYVSFETAKLLKEKGFDENTPVNYFIGDNKPCGCVVGEMIYHKRTEEDMHLIACPTLQMAMKWLREVHEKWITITFHWHTVDGETTLYYSPYIMLNEYENVVNVVLEDKNPFKMKLFNSYEEACEAAIKYCLENLIVK